MLKLRGGIDSVPRREGSSQVLDRWAMGPPLNVAPRVYQVSTRRGRACMGTVGCLLASEQLVRIHYTPGIQGISDRVVENKRKIVEKSW